MNILKRCWQNRWIRRLAWSVITFITLYALLCTWLNWRWGRQWAATVDMLRTEGESLNIRSVMNGPLPEEENFCAIPLLKDIALVVDNDPDKGEPGEKRKRLKALELPSAKSGGARPKLANPGLGEALDLSAWAAYLREEGSLPLPPDSGNPARDLVAGLAKHDAIVQELTSGLDRPYAQWTPEWKTRQLPDWLLAIQTPHYIATRSMSRVLALRSAAAARAGESMRAHEETLIMTRIAQADLNDPFVIGLLVAAANTSAICGSTWELCNSHAGTAEEFARLESALVALDFHRGALRAFRSEMAAVVNTFELLKQRPSRMVSLLGAFDDVSPEDDPRGSVVMRAIPSGFFDASAAVLADCEFKYLIKPLRDHGFKVALEAAGAYEKELIEMKSKIWLHPTHVMTVLTAPAMSQIVRKVAYTQAIVNQAVIACALERHRIENGSYPESLDQLKLANGKPLPPDVMNNQPMAYRRTPDGKYMLWSVGFDGKDDGGRRVLDKKQPEKTRFSDAGYAGDWVWGYTGFTAR